MMTREYLSVRQVAAIYGVSKATIWRWAKLGILQPPIKVGPNTTRWLAADLEARGLVL